MLHGIDPTRAHAGSDTPNVACAEQSPREAEESTGPASGKIYRFFGKRYMAQMCTSVYSEYGVVKALFSETTLSTLLPSSLGWHCWLKYDDSLQCCMARVKCAVRLNAEYELISTNDLPAVFCH